MNVNQKGVSGLIKVLDDLQSKGFYTFPAFDDHSPVDLIAMNGEGRPFRLQVKYRTKNAKGKYELPASSVVNKKRIPIDMSLIDGWAVYLSDHGKVAYIPKSKMENRSVLYLDGTEEYGELAEWRLQEFAKL